MEWKEQSPNIYTCFYSGFIITKVVTQAHPYAQVFTSYTAVDKDRAYIFKGSNLNKIKSDILATYHTYLF